MKAFMDVEGTHEDYSVLPSDGTTSCIFWEGTCTYGAPTESLSKALQLVKVSIIYTSCQNLDLSSRETKMVWVRVSSRANPAP